MYRIRPVTISAALLLIVTACSRHGPDAGAGSQSPAAADEVPPISLPPGNTHPETPPRESGLAMRRGVVTFESDHAVFRPCGEKVDLWVTDQTDGMLDQAKPEAANGSRPMLYIEAHGERGDVPKGIPEAARFAGAFQIEQLLYAISSKEAPGCAAAEPDYQVQAQGSEPSWSVEVRSDKVIWRQPGSPGTIDFPAAQSEDAEGNVSYRAQTAQHHLELLVAARICRDAMSGAFYSYAARAQLDGKTYEGCARLGKVAD